jgi:hypothetical protein
MNKKKNKKKMNLKIKRNNIKKTTSMSMKIKSTEFDVSKVSFTMKVDKESKRKIFYVNHNKQPILIQTPKMYLPNGIKHWVSAAYPESFELELSFGEDKENAVNNKNIQDFHEKMKALDTLIKEQILTNPKDWVGKQKASMELIEESYYPNPIVRVPKDKEGHVLEYPDRMRIKVERERENDNYTGFFVSNRRYKSKVMVFDEKNENLNLDETNFESVIPRGSKGITVIELVNINVVGDKVYPKWKFIQGKVFRNQKSITENIIDDPEEEVPEDLDSESPVVEKLADLKVEEPVEEDPTEEVVEADDDLEEVKAPVKKGKGKRGLAA